VMAGTEIRQNSPVKSQVCRNSDACLTAREARDIGAENPQTRLDGSQTASHGSDFWNFCMRDSHAPLVIEMNNNSYHFGNP
jgi:hypothetical protein